MLMWFLWSDACTAQWVYHHVLQYGAVSLTLVKEQHFIRIIYCYYYYGSFEDGSSASNGDDVNDLQKDTCTPSHTSSQCKYWRFYFRFEDRVPLLENKSGETVFLSWIIYVFDCSFVQCNAFGRMRTQKMHVTVTLISLIKMWLKAALFNAPYGHDLVHIRRYLVDTILFISDGI